MLDLSFVIVSWNAKQYLLDCLRSIEETVRGISYEIIVVDNQSADGSADAVERDFPSVKLIRSETNLGFAGGNNVGIRSAAGRYTFLVNSDVLLEPHCVERLIKFLDVNPRVGIAGPRILNADRTLQLSCRRLPTLRNSLCRMLALDTMFPKSKLLSGWHIPASEHSGTKNVEALSGCFWAARKGAIDQVGLLDEGYFMYAEDIDWCKRFHEAGWDLCYYPEAEAIHFGGASSANAPERFFVEMQRADLRYWKKHHGVLGQACYAAIIMAHQVLRIIPRAILYLIFPSKREKNAPHLRRSAACIQWLLGFNRAYRT